MSTWKDLSLYDKISAILTDVPDYLDSHHFKRPYLTAYQIAIEFSIKYKNDYEKIGLQVGGKNIGSKTSLAQYFSKQLSDRIKSGEIKDIEGAFISNEHLKDISFKINGDEIHSSLTETQFTLSMYRKL